MTEQYNGWANYETWRVNLEMLDGMTPEDFGYESRALDTDDYETIERLADSSLALNCSHLSKVR